MDWTKSSGEPLTSEMRGKYEGLQAVRWVAIGLAMACLAVFGQAVRFAFLNYDDNAYITENPWVRGGLTLPGLIWAFRNIDYFYWQPLTWISHMLDCQLFGLRAGWHHAGSIALHAANCVLVFAILRRTTGAVWRSAAAAALWALHPLRLESVAWIAERKDVLSAFWFLVMAWAYVRYVERPSRPQYWAVMGALACGLMSKPMLIMAPALLLVLDWWPLKRRAWAEKIPLFGMAAATLAITYVGTSHGEWMNWAAKVPLWHRSANAVVNYAAYLWLTVWPRRLAILYPYRMEIPWWQPAGAAVLIAAASWAAWRYRLRYPYVAAGWVWFAVAILPPIGVVQVGRQAMADRFTYIPAIGLAVAAVWGAAELSGRRALAGGLAGAAVAACAGASLAHIGTWRDSVTVWENAVAVTGDNSGAQHYLASALDDVGRWRESLPHHAEAVRIEPKHFIAQYAYGLCLEREGRWEAAAEHFGAAVRGFAGYGDARFHLGMDWIRLGRTAEGRAELERALALGLSEADGAEARRVLAAQ